MAIVVVYPDLFWRCSLWKFVGSGLINSSFCAVTLRVKTEKTYVKSFYLASCSRICHTKLEIVVYSEFLKKDLILM